MACVGTEADIEQASGAFRQYLPDLSTARFQAAKQQDAHSYAHAFKNERKPPWLFNLTQAWERLYDEPFKGITSDGKMRHGLFHEQDEGVEPGPIVEAVEHVLAQITPEQRQKLMHPLEAREWRAWSNPEVLLRPYGLRLDDLPVPAAEAILGVLQATFSSEGYRKALAAMRINHFLGEICDIPKIMNRFSYNFLLFGNPSSDEPWGWSLYGHHLCLNVFIRGSQIVVSPTFTGAEPNVIDTGDFRGTEILHQEGRLGLQLMQSLSVSQQQRAQTYKTLRDPKMQQTGDLTTDRWNKDDQRHLCGAFRDNRMVPYEGITVQDMNTQQRQLVLDICEQFHLYLPRRAREARKRQIGEFFGEMFFSWIGGYGDEAAFYYRIQSPVVVLEFDHHSGVFLANEEPAKFHVHTIVRTPNGGDYGFALRGDGRTETR